ncbi:hypothetical protein ACIQF6_28885 [Kitasatospora sp. NPDC092948]|uniref:hypothetical protein n=1 Tax=Kitasatospora sp. NPDC092948 TaxID=3364088 RepID=UPI003812B87C
MFPTLHRTLPWKKAQAELALPAHREQLDHLTVHTRVRLTFRIPLELTFTHRETPAGWERLSLAVHPSDKADSASARTALATLEPLVVALLADPALRADLGPLREEVLRWQAAVELKAVRRRRAEVAAAAAGLREQEREFARYGIDWEVAAATLVEVEARAAAETARWLGHR